MNKISIVIPAYNEEKNLGKNLKVIFNSFPNAEVILINDGSTDKTDGIAKRYIAKLKYFPNEKNMGKSYSVRLGMMEATGDIIIFTDADLPFGVEGIKKVINAIKDGSEIVIAEKLKTARSPIYLIERFFMRKIIRILFGIKHKDTQAGLKGFTNNSAKAIYSETFTNKFAGDIEVLYLAKKRKLKVTAIPLDLRDKKLRASHFNLKQEVIFLFDLLRIRIHKYDK